MQELYYDTSGSLRLVKENSTVLTWGNTEITSLVVSSSLNQILALTGSTVVANFPLSNTNIYYPPFPILNNSYTPPSTNINNSTSSYSTIGYTFSTLGSFTPADISGSYFSIFDAASYTSSVSITGSNVNGQVNVISGNTYVVSVNNTPVSTPYTASLFIQDNTLSKSSPYYVYTGSALSIQITGSFTPVANHVYSVNLSISNDVIPVDYWFDVTSSYTDYQITQSVFLITDISSSVALGTTGASGRHHTGSGILSSNNLYEVQIYNASLSSFTGSISIYNTRVGQYMYSQSALTGSELYGYPSIGYIAPQSGDHYIISASFGQTP